MPEASIGVGSRPVVARTRAAVGRTRRVTSVALERTDGRLAFAIAALGYTLAYLVAIGHLATGLGGFDVLLVEDPIGTLAQTTGPWSFRPVARVTLGPLTYLFALNSILGLGVGVLVGLNLALAVLTWRQPHACGRGGSTAGVLAGLPALLSGTACCGPVVLIVIGVQASGLLLTAFELLLPIAVLLLVGSLFLASHQVDPERL